MKNHSRIIFRVLITIVLVFSSYYMFAPPGNPGGTGAPACWPPPCIPIDGGISALLIVGAVLGIKKTYDSYKINKKVEE